MDNPKTKQGAKRWVKYNEDNLKQKTLEKYKDIQKKLKGYKTYFIHSNYLRPYLIYVKKDVYIYKIDDNIINEYDYYSTDYNKNKWMYTKLIKYFKPKKIFVGKSPLIEMTNFSGGFGKEFDGNTILLLLDKNKYVYVDGDKGIFKFSTKNDEIIKYYSPVGNNDIPYPLAIGEKYIYFFYYPNGYLDKEEFPKIKNIQDIQKVFEMGELLDPFLFSLDTHRRKQNKITLKQFENIQQKTLNEISLNELKELAKMYNITTSGSKKELANRIEKKSSNIYRK